MNKKNIIITIVSVLILTCLFAFARTTTTNLGLVQPTWEEAVDILTDFNANMSLIDDAFDAGAITETMLDVDNAPVDEYVLTWEATSSKMHWQVEAAGGAVDTSGTPVANDIARFTDLNTIEGLSYAEFKAALDLEAGTDIQAYDAGLLSIAGLTTAANKSIYTTALDTYATYTLTAFGRSILDDADEAVFKATVNLEIGTDVLAQQTIGIANNNLVEIDFASVANDDYAKFTATGLEGRSYAEVWTDIGTTLAFTGLTDTPANYTDAGRKVIRVNAGGTALEYVTKTKLDSTSAPTVNNDGTEYFGVGSRWVDVTNDKEYVCLDASTGAAVWIETTATATAGLPVADTTGIVKGSVDATKIVRFEVDGLTTETTRVLTVQDKDITIAEAGANSSITSLTGLTTPLGAAYGGTGVANAAGETITLTGGFALNITLTETTGVTLPASGTLINSTDTAAVATAITIADESADTTCFPLFVTAATGDLAGKSGTNLAFNSNTGILTVTGFAGALTGNVTGNCSGSSGTCSGLAATATALATGRTIGGVSFDGTANIVPNIVTDTTPELGGEMDCGAHSIGFTQQTVSYNVTTTTVDWKLGNKATVTLTGNVGTLAFTNPTNPCNVLLKIIQDGTGSRLITNYDADVKWVGGTKPTLTTTANGIDIISAYWDGTNYFGVASLAFATP